jgi:hypothetical protein
LRSKQAKLGKKRGAKKRGAKKALITIGEGVIRAGGPSVLLGEKITEVLQLASFLTCLTGVIPE